MDKESFPYMTDSTELEEYQRNTCQQSAWKDVDNITFEILEISKSEVGAGNIDGLWRSHKRTPLKIPLDLRSYVQLYEVELKFLLAFFKQLVLRKKNYKFQVYKV